VSFDLREGLRKTRSTYAKRYVHACPASGHEITALIRARARAKETRIYMSNRPVAQDRYMDPPRAQYS
jgi:hypothetical protein